MIRVKKQLFKHQAFITGIVVMVVVVSTIGGSYAWFNSQMMKDEYNAFKEEDFEISYVASENGYGDILSLVNQKPISDVEGEKLKPYRFNVTNLGTTEKNFSLKINIDQSIIEQDNCIDKLLSTSYIKYKFDNEEPKRLSLLELNDYEIYLSNETLMPGSSEIHELRIWISDDSPSNVTSKHFHALVSVESAEKSKQYKTYKMGQEVALLDGSKYHVLEDSNENQSKVKLLSDYNIDFKGNQDVKCINEKFIKEKVLPEELTLYCSTGEYNNQVNILYSKYLENIQNSLKKYEKRIDNIEVRMPQKDELIKALSIGENTSLVKDSSLSWLENLNFWTMTNSDNSIDYTWTLSSDIDKVELKQYKNDSKYFGLRPVIIIDKDNVK